MKSIFNLLTICFFFTFLNEIHSQRQMDVEGNATSTELVEFVADALSGGYDVLQLRVPPGSGPIQGDFLECNLGVANPVAKIRADGSAVFKSVEFEDGTVQTSAQGLPIAFGYINSNGSTSSSYGSFSASWNAGLMRYEIEITGENYLFNDYATLVTPTGVNIKPRTASNNGDLLVYLYNWNGDLVSGSFQFVTFKP